MQEEKLGQKAVFGSKMIHEILMAPLYLMYLTILLVGMYVVDRFVPAVDFSGTNFMVVTGLYMLFYFVNAYFSLGKNYQDLIVQEDKIQIINRVPGFRKQVVVQLVDIEAILFSESHLNLDQPHVVGILQETFRHPERKWVEIHTKNDSVRARLYGLSSHLSWEKLASPSYQDLYAYLKQDRGLPVRMLSEVA